MLIGLCGNAVASAQAIAAAPLDYVEENVQNFLMAESDDAAFTAKLATVPARSILAACCFLPGRLACVGPNVDAAAIDAYAQTAFRRAKTVGIDTIVFGSGGARAVPKDWDPRKAMDQFVDLLKRLAPKARDNGITIVVEPLNRSECNFINSLAEGAEAVTRCNHPSVRLLADIYHMLREDEPPQAIRTHGALLAHVHIAEKKDRTAPGTVGDDFGEYLSALRHTGYDHRISLECKFTDLARELNPSVAALRQQLTAAGYKAGAASSHAVKI
jgi:sugar phosphate isomerase/epimerase